MERPISEQFKIHITEMLNEVMEMANIPLDSKFREMMLNNLLSSIPDGLSMNDVKSVFGLQNLIDKRKIKSDIDSLSNIDNEYNAEYGEEIMRFNRAYLVKLSDIGIQPEMKIKILEDQRKKITNEIYIINSEDYKNSFTPHLNKINEIIDIQYTKIDDNINKSIVFISKLNHKQIKMLHTELKQQKYTSQPQKLIDFLGGKNDVDVSIYPNRLHHISYLLYRLYSSKSGVLKLNIGKGFYTHFQNYIKPFCNPNNKLEMKELKRRVITSKYKKGHVQADVEAILSNMNIN